MSEKYSVAILFILLIALSLNLTTVLAQLTIRPDTLPNAVIGQFYSIQLYTEPKRTVDNWEISSGSLPPGLTLSKQDAYNAVISGTPSSIGTYQFTVKARITVLGQPQPIYIYKDYTINVEGLAISPDSLPEATENSSYGATIQVTGGTPPYSWGVTGLSTERTNLTWQVIGCCPVGRTDRISIYGKPLIGSHGEYSVEVRVRDNKGLTASKTYTLRIKEVPWTYSVTVRRLTDEGEESRAVVYLDDIVLGRARGIEKSLFEVTVRCTSGVGSRTFSVAPCFVTAEGGTSIDIPGVTLSPESRFCTGVVNSSKDLVCRIVVVIDMGYPYLSEERDFMLRITTDCEDPTPAGPAGRDVRIVTVSFKGISPDITVSAIPVQVLIDDSIPLVEGKSTIFKIDVEARCSRTPKTRGMYVNVSLALPVLEWDLELYDGTDGTFSFVKDKFVYLTFDGSSRAHATLYLPEVHSIVGTGWLTGDPVVGRDFSGRYLTASFPKSTPRPRYVSAYPRGYPREGGTVSYIVRVETMIGTSAFQWVATVVRTTTTKPLRIMFAACGYPFAVTESVDFDTYVREYGASHGIRSYSELYARYLIPTAREMIEYLQAIFPTSENGIHYQILIGVDDIFWPCRESDLWDPSYCRLSATAYKPDCVRCFLTEILWNVADGCECDLLVDLLIPGCYAPMLHGSRYNVDDPGDAFSPGFIAFICPRYWGTCYECLLPREEYSSKVTIDFAKKAYHALTNGFGIVSAQEGYWVNKGMPIERENYWGGGNYEWITPDGYRALIDFFVTRRSTDPMAMRISGIIYPNETGGLETGRLKPIKMRNATWVASPGVPGNYSIVLLDSKDIELSRFGINPISLGGIHVFRLYVPFSENIRAVELRDSENRILDKIIASANKPQVKVLTPKPGEIVSSLKSNFTISWEGSDADGDKLYYTVLISPDGGESWQPVSPYFDIIKSSVKPDPRFYNASENYMIKVIVSDGFHSGENVSGVFTIGPYVQLKVESPYGDTKGSGWYMVNETATFTVAPTQVEMEGFLGLLGGYYEFAGWSGDSSSTSPSSTIMMNNDKTVIAVFKPNYTMPILCLAIVVVITLLVLTIILRRKQRLPPPP